MKTSYGSKQLPYLRPHRLRFLCALAQVFLITGFELLKPWPHRSATRLNRLPEPIAGGARKASL